LTIQRHRQYARKLLFVVVVVVVVSTYITRNLLCVEGQRKNKQKIWNCLMGFEFVIRFLI
jgi:hypothetical protein